MIVIFNGPPGSGKDEGAIIFKMLGSVHLSFKEELFKATVKEFGVTLEWFMKDYDNREIKERPQVELRGKSRREALIYTSEVIIKPKYGKRFFGDKVAEAIDSRGDYVLSDGGFTEEALPIIEKVGVENVLIVRLFREGFSFEGDSRRYLNGKVRQTYTTGKKSQVDNDYVLSDKLDSPIYDMHNNGDLEDFHNELILLHSDIVEKRKRGEFL